MIEFYNKFNNVPSKVSLVYLHILNFFISFFSVKSIYDIYNILHSNKQFTFKIFDQNLLLIEMYSGLIALIFFLYIISTVSSVLSCTLSRINILFFFFIFLLICSQLYIIDTLYKLDLTTFKSFKFDFINFQVYYNEGFDVYKNQAELRFNPTQKCRRIENLQNFYNSLSETLTTEEKLIRTWPELIRRDQLNIEINKGETRIYKIFFMLFLFMYIMNGNSPDPYSFGNGLV